MNLKHQKDRAVIAIGVFDGVHRGHQVLFERVRRTAVRADCLAGVVTFDPPPYALLSGDPTPLEITPLREKAALLAELGIERMLVLPFTRSLAALSPERFVDDVLLQELDLEGVVVGHDFRFGAHRAGDGELLRALGAARGFTVEIVAPVERGGSRVSSTRLRHCIAGGRVEEAAELAGRVLAVEGRVGRGQGLGARELVPTANVEVDPRQLLPAPGVYAVEVSGRAGWFGGAASVGRAPTLGTGHDRLVEVHLLDFEGDLRGVELRVGFVARLREIRAFRDLAELRAAIADDIRAARERLGLRPGGRTRPGGDRRGRAERSRGQNRLAAPGSL